MKTLITNKTMSALLITILTLSGAAANAHPNFGNTSASEDLVGIAQQVINIVNAERPAATYEQLGEFILPIRKAAVNLQVMGTMHFPSERAAICAITKLENAITRAQYYISEQLETDTGFQLAQELMIAHEQLNNFTRDIPSAVCYAPTYGPAPVPAPVVAQVPVVVSAPEVETVVQAPAPAAKARKHK